MTFIHKMAGTVIGFAPLYLTVFNGLIEDIRQRAVSLVVTMHDLDVILK